jgi:hypothetical protein
MIGVCLQKMHEGKAFLKVNLSSFTNSLNSGEVFYSKGILYRVSPSATCDVVGEAYIMDRSVFCSAKHAHSSKRLLFLTLGTLLMR